MIRSSATIAADDVSVRCRIRRSKVATQPEFDYYVDMVCTMRSWHHSPDDLLKMSSTASKPSSLTMDFINWDMRHTGPELLLNPLVDFERDSDNSSRSHRSGNTGSFSGKQPSALRRMSSSGSRTAWEKRNIWQTSNSVQSKPVEPISIAILDIVVVDTESGDNSPILVTTMSHGLLEFTFATSNSRDVLLAFLSASLPPERITTKCPSPTCSTTSDSNSETYDVDALTANYMHQHVKSETFSGRMRRKMALWGSRVVELSQSVSECACGGPPCDPTPTNNSKKTFEMEDRYTKPSLRKCQVPSGISIELSTDVMSQ